MTTAGLPDASTLATYGGAKVNRAPVSNPQTDRDALAANQCFADAAGMTRTAIRAWALFTAASSTGALVLLDWDAVWAAATPTAPALAHASTGIFTVTFPVSIVDELGNTHAPSFRRGKAFVVSGTTPFHTITTWTANVGTVRVLTAAASPALSDAVGTNFLVELG